MDHIQLVSVCKTFNELSWQANLILVRMNPQKSKRIQHAYNLFAIHSGFFLHTQRFELVPPSFTKELNRAHTHEKTQPTSH